MVTTACGTVMLKTRLEETGGGTRRGNRSAAVGIAADRNDAGARTLEGHAVGNIQLTMSQHDGRCLGRIEDG
jgi:hypothetical protein